MAAPDASVLNLVTAVANTVGFSAGFYLFVTGRLHSSGEVERLAEDKLRIIAERDKAEEQRDSLQELIRREIVPLLGSFTSATSSLLPILQGLVRQREDDSGRRREERGRY